MASIPRQLALCVALCTTGCPDDPASDTSEDGTSTGGDPTTTGGPSTTMDPPDTTTGEESTGDPSTTTTDDPSTSSSSSGSDSSSSTTAVEECQLQIVEVLYDAVGDDDMLQWAKIYNPCDEDFDLRDITVGWGTEGWDGHSWAIQAPMEEDPILISAGGCLVTGGPTESADNGSPMIIFQSDFSPGLFGDAGGSGVALFDIQAGMSVADATPFDAVIYGDSNDGGLIDTTGKPGTPDIGLTGEGESIRRIDAEGNWEVAETPSPNDCPPY